MTLAPDDRYKLYQPVVLTTDFLTLFPLFDDDDLEVVVDGVAVTAFSVNSTYVNGRSDDAEIVLNTAVTGVDVEIYGKRDPRRENDYLANSPDLADNLQRDIEATTAVQQEQKRDFGSSLKVSPQDSVTAMPDNAAARASRVPAFSSDGLALVAGPTVDEVANAQGYAIGAAASEAAALISEGLADADAVQTALDVLATAADVISTNADVVSTNADAVQTAIDVLSTAADVISTAADAVSTGADATQTGIDAAATAADAVQTALDVIQTGLDVIAAAASADAAAASAAAAVKEWFVDSASGSDSNDGSTSAQAFLTISKVVAEVSEGDTIKLRGGSHWREELDLSSYSQVHTRAYGDGARPLLDCSNIEVNANFTKTGGLTNVYDALVSHDLSASIQSFSVFEDDVRLIRATSQANCDATAGSFYAPTPDVGVDQNIYVHSSDSSSVITNGKVYEISVRKYGLRGSSTGYIIGIHTRRNGHNDGSLLSYTYAYDCLAEDGTKHNFWNGGLARQCTAFKGEDYVSAGSSTLFVSYSTIGTGKAFRYVGCTAIGNSRSSGQVGFFAHTAGATDLDLLVYEGCVAHDLGLDFGSSDALKRIYYECRAHRCGQSIAGGQANTGLCRTSIIGGVYSAWDIDDLIGVRHIAPSGGEWFVRGTVFISRAVSGAMIYGGFTNGIGADVENCDFIFADKSGSPHTPLRCTNASGIVNFQRNVVLDASTGLHIQNGATFVSDYNNFYPANMDMTVNGVTYTDIASYVAASGEDTNSVTTDPTITNGARLEVPDYAFASGVWAIRAGSKALSPAQRLSLFNAELAA